MVPILWTAYVKNRMYLSDRARGGPCRWHERVCHVSKILNPPYHIHFVVFSCAAYIAKTGGSTLREPAWLP